MLSAHGCDNGTCPAFLQLANILKSFTKKKGTESELEVWDTAGILRLKSKPEMCLDAAGGHLNKGDNILIWPCHGGANQLFQFTENRIRMKARPDMCLSVA